MHASIRVSLLEWSVPDRIQLCHRQGPGSRSADFDKDVVHVLLYFARQYPSTRHLPSLIIPSHSGKNKTAPGCANIPPWKTLMASIRTRLEFSLISSCCSIEI